MIWSIFILSIMMICFGRLPDNESPWCILFFLIVCATEHLDLNSIRAFWCHWYCTCQINKQMLSTNNKSHQFHLYKRKKWQIQVDSWHTCTPTYTVRSMKVETGKSLNMIAKYLCEKKRLSPYPNTSAHEHIKKKNQSSSSRENAFVALNIHKLFAFCISNPMPFKCCLLESKYKFYTYNIFVRKKRWMSVCDLNKYEFFLRAFFLFTHTQEIAI